MPRTVLASTALVKDGSVAAPTYVANDFANGMQVNIDETERVFLHVKNTTAGAVNVIVRAGDKDPAFRRQLGDLTVSVPATTGDRLIGPFESARFESNGGGQLWVDFSAAAGTIAAFRLPK